MSLRRPKNPVNNYFIYNDDIRKSTCKVCYFDMAGRHSENLMRHLKRKHPSTYAEVMLAKQQQQQQQQQRRRSTNTKTNRSGSAGTGTGTDPLSAMFRFETEPHKLFIKSEKLEFRLEEPGQKQRNGIEDEVSGGYNCDNIVNNDDDDADDDEEEDGREEDQSVDQLHDTSISNSYEDIHNDVYQFIITSLPEQQQQQQVANVTPKGTSVQIGNPIKNTMSQVANDDASLLQLLGYKFNKYTPITKYTVQYHINRILYKADMGCYDNVDASRLPDSDL